MSEERSQFARRIDEHTFSPSRRGYNKDEVKSYLEDLEQAFRELEGHARRQGQKLAELEHSLSKARATEKVSVDNAMMAVFDAKDRILERARHKADEIEEEARLEAGRIREAAIAEAGGSDGAAAGEIAAARSQADEIVANARKEADRLRSEVGAATDENLETELADMASRLGRAHDETAAAKEELDSARKRIVELEAAAPEGDSAELKERFAQLEDLVGTARAEADRLREEVEKERTEVEAARSAAVTVEEAHKDLEKRYEGLEAELETAKSELAAAAPGTEVEELRRELEQERARVAELGEADRLREEAESQRETIAADLAATAAALEQLQNEAVASEDLRAETDAKAPALSEAATFASRMVGFESQMASMAGTAEAVALLTETRRIAQRDDGDPTSGEAEAILAAAHEQAEVINAEAEAQAEQRAAKVIAKAREEADQVRQTVSTLTAQAEDARAAALRSKLEAEDLAEAQRAIGEARDDIVAAAEDRAKEIREDAERAAAAMRRSAEEALEAARTEARRITTEAAEQAQETIAVAQEETGEEPEDTDQVLSTQSDVDETGDDAPEVAEPGDDLAALLAQAERDLAGGDELRRQQQELDQREAELAAQQAEAILLATTRESGHVEAGSDPEVLESEGDSDSAATSEPEPAPQSVDERVTEPVSVTDEISAEPPIVEFDDFLAAADEAEKEAAEGDGGDSEEDPAELLSALLEEVASDLEALDLGDDAEAVESGDVQVEESFVTTGEEVEVPSSDEPRPRVAWPVPVDLDSPGPDGVGHDERDKKGGKRESRYRSSSAQLPRLGSQAKSSMKTMANLRKKSRGIDED